jgi:hypothetical protein
VREFTFVRRTEIRASRGASSLKYCCNAEAS